MALQITGQVESVGPLKTIDTKDGSQIYRRELILDATRHDAYTGERSFENHPCIEFAGDKCELLNQVKKGDLVTVSFDVQGANYLDKDGNPANYTRCRGYKIEPLQKRQQTKLEGHQPTSGDYQSGQQPGRNQRPQQFRQPQRPEPLPFDPTH